MRTERPRLSRHADVAKAMDYMLANQQVLNCRNVWTASALFGCSGR